MHVSESLEEERKIEKEREIERKNAKTKKSKKFGSIQGEKVDMTHSVAYFNICQYLFHKRANQRCHP